MSNLNQLKLAFSTLFSPLNDNDALISEFFTEDYVQWVDGKQIDRKGFQQHLTALKAKVESCDFQFLSLFSQDNQVHSTHIVTAYKRNKQTSRIKVIANITFREGRICACEELTYVLVGANTDHNLGACR